MKTCTTCRNSVMTECPDGTTALVCWQKIIDERCITDLREMERPACNQWRSWVQ